MPRSLRRAAGIARMNQGAGLKEKADAGIGPEETGPPPNR